MLKHIVMWKFKGNREERRRTAETVREKLTALVPIIPEIRFLEVGINENDSDAAYDAVLVSEFGGAEDLNRYREHEEHRKVSSYVSEARVSRIVTDYTV